MLLKTNLKLLSAMNKLQHNVENKIKKYKNY
jgi:hypothetical protein